MNTEALLAQLLDLEQRKAHIDTTIKEVKAQLLAEAETGTVLSIGDTPVYKVTQRRSFDERIAHKVLPAEVIVAYSEPKLNATRLHQDHAALWDKCCTLGEPYLVKAKS